MENELCMCVFNFQFTVLIFLSSVYSLSINNKVSHSSDCEYSSGDVGMRLNFAFMFETGSLFQLISSS